MKIANNLNMNTHNTNNQHNINLDQANIKQTAPYHNQKLNTLSKPSSQHNSPLRGQESIYPVNKINSNNSYNQSFGQGQYLQRNNQIPSQQNEQQQRVAQGPMSPARLNQTQPNLQIKSPIKPTTGLNSRINPGYAAGQIINNHANTSNIQKAQSHQNTQLYKGNKTSSGQVYNPPFSPTNARVKIQSNQSPSKIEQGNNQDSSLRSRFET